MNKNNSMYIIIIPKIDTLEHRIFNYMLHLPLGQYIVEWLCREININRMINICINNEINNEKIAALKALDDDIYQEFVSPISKMSRKEVDKWKQFIGYIVRVILEANGFEHIECVAVEDGKLFSNASSYRRK